ncbi:GAF domain-containing protein [Mitsuaria sp. GD03876]|uniref:GAF domain-containing protein n=1 Tax=Mitsuaria sp. GD03876 TaxID=2975399 RepID=UPI00244D7A9D|nr:GAF domain-containing protein [Mitsuaria sp. GD03876]MDH0862971.1 GAF domain-containing protein [Mitsuaria sp. GD03876]
MSAPTGLSLRARLYLVLGLALALVGASALLGWWQSQRLAGIAQSLYEDRLVPVDLLRELEHALGAQQLGAVLIAQAQQPDAAKMDSAGRRLADSTRRLWSRYLATRMVPAESALIARTQPLLDQLWSALTIGQAPTPDALRELNQRRLATMKMLDELIAFQLSQARVDTERAQQAATDAARLGLLLVLLTAGLCSIVVCTVWTRYDDERRAGQHSRQRLQQLYIALSQTNQLIVRREAEAFDDPAAEQHLFEGICRICVETGHARFASVVLVDGDQFERVAEFGPGDRLMPGAPRQWGRDAPFARSSMATRAIAGGTHQVSNRALEDPHLAVPGAPMIPPGVESMAAFPLRRCGEVVGALSLLAGEPDYFDPQVLGLIDEMAGDLSFALEHLKRERDQARELERLRDALHRSEQGLSDTAPAAFRPTAAPRPAAESSDATDQSEHGPR